MHYSVFARGSKPEKGHIIVWTSIYRNQEHRYIRSGQRLIPVESLLKDEVQRLIEYLERKDIGL
jgi:hypothetical protein